MKEQFDLLDGSAKRRFIIFAVITVIAAMLAVGYVRETYDDFATVAFDADGIDMQVDGASFNWFFVPLMYGVSGLLSTFMMLVSMVFQTVIDLVLYSVFRLFAFRNVVSVRKEEYALAWRVLLAVLAAGVVIALFSAHFQFLMLAILLHAPAMLFGLLFYILPLKKRIQDTDTIYDTGGLQ